MTRRTLPLALVAGAVIASAAAGAQVAIALKSVDVNLPGSSRELPNAPPEAGVCLACHSAGMILNQPAMTRAAWEAEVEKMRHAYQAPVNPKDVPRIVDYLTAIKGSK